MHKAGDAPRAGKKLFADPAHRAGLLRRGQGDELHQTAAIPGFAYDGKAEDVVLAYHLAEFLFLAPGVLPAPRMLFGRGGVQVEAFAKFAQGGKHRHGARSLEHAVFDFHHGAGSPGAKAQLRSAVRPGGKGEFHLIAAMPFRRLFTAARIEGGAYQAVRNVEPADTAQGIVHQPCLPLALDGVGHILPGAAAAGVGMGAWGGALFGGAFQDFEKFGFAKPFFECGQARAYALACKAALHEDGHAFFGASDGPPVGREAVQSKFQSIALFVFHVSSPSWDGLS